MSDINTTGLTTTGYNIKTLNHLLLDAGALYKNFGLEGQTLIGATSGGNELDIKAKVRQIAVDGVKADNAKGLEVIDSVSTSLKCNFLEMTEEILKAALIADVDSVSDTNYDIMTGKTIIEDTDYIKNIAWVGTISGKPSKPIIIVIYNALCLDGLQLKAVDSKDNVLAVTFTAHADPTTPQALPYKIYYPKLTDMVAFNLVSAAVSTTKVILTMSDTVAATVPFDGFTVKVAGSADVITAAARGTDTKTIELTLTTAPTTGQGVTIAYAKPTDITKQVTSANGVELDNIATTSVQNS
jgi:hypothetical protein